jgi:hypothetical protein
MLNIFRLNVSAPPLDKFPNLTAEKFLNILKKKIPKILIFFST